jgi:DNA-directed RNA polymerase specialized sigma24 family protein
MGRPRHQSESISAAIRQMYLDGLTSSQIAGIIGLPQSNVDARLARLGLRVQDRGRSTVEFWVEKIQGVLA